MTHDSDAASLPNRIIRASAGTGKTFQLTNRFLALLLRGVSADQILATTFTRKAAGEILDRVILRLAKAALETKAREDLGAFLQEPSLSETTCLEVLHRLLQNLHRLRIGTLDSFFVQLARSFSLELDLPGVWHVVDPVEETSFRDQTIEAMLPQEQTSDLVNLAHLLTKGETHRSVAELIRGTVQDLHSIYLDSDDRAWKRLPQSKPCDGESLQLLFDQLRAAEFPDRRFTKARDSDLEHATNDEWEAFVKRGLAGKILSGVGQYYGRPIPPEVVETYQKLLNHARALLLGRLSMQNEGSYGLLERYDREFCQLKRDRRILRFSDVTRELAGRFTPVECRTGDGDDSSDGGRGLGTRSESLTYRLDGHIHHLLLDEFQDTAPAQWRVLRPFAERTVRDSPLSTFFCVGDIKQAIYGWRGGVAEIFDAVGKQLPGLDHHQLDTSYRSSQPVIDTVNRVFQSLDRHSNLGSAENAVKSWQKQFREHSTSQHALRGYVALQTAPAPREGRSQAETTLEYTAETIAGLAHSMQQSIGVLVRKNETVGKLIYGLRSLKVAASEEGGNPLVDSAAVQILLSLLRLADHPGDTVARFHIANSPLSDHLGLANAQDEAAASLAAKKTRGRLLDDGYGPTIAALAKRLWPDCSRRESNRLEQLVEMAYAYQSRATLRTDDFIQLVEKQKIADPTSAGIRVMTIHQAKGLEFDTVVLPELDFAFTGQPDTFVVERDDPTGPVHRVCRYVNQDLQQLLPMTVQRMFATATNRWVTESLCVLYVALTRAIHELRLIVAPSTGSEKKLPKSYAGLLRAALAEPGPAPAGTVLHEHGDRSWPETTLAGTTAVDDGASTREASVMQVKLAPASGPRRRGLDRVSPSSLEGGSRVRLAEVLRPADGHALTRGTLIHALFEQIEWLDDGPPDARRLSQAAQAVLLENGQPATDLTQLLREFDTMLASPAINAVLKRSAYQSLADLPIMEPLEFSQPQNVQMSVETERVFAIRDDDRLINGSIDRLVLIYLDGKVFAADILDFKSDVIDPGDSAQVEKRKEFYRPQLLAYRLAVAKMTGLVPGRIATRLVFVTAGSVETL